MVMTIGGTKMMAVIHMADLHHRPFFSYLLVDQPAQFTPN
jgi:hypothetical protein